MGTWLDMGNLWEDHWMIFWEMIGNTLGMHMDHYGIVMGELWDSYGLLASFMLDSNKMGTVSTLTCPLPQQGGFRSPWMVVKKIFLWL